MRNRIKAISTPTKILAGVVAGLLAGGAAVYAHNGDPGQVHSCVNFGTAGANVHVNGGPSDGAFVGSADAGCGPGEVAVDWSAVGPAGPQGATGPQGPAGSASSGTLRTVRKQIGPNKAFVKTGRANCPKGQHVVSGGYSMPGNLPGVNIKESRPSGTTGWYARAFRARGSGPWTFVVYALCST